MDGYNEWVTDLYDCLKYSDPVTGRLGCFPVFFPRAMTCPCGLFGRIESLLENENEINCCCFKICLPGVGPEGLAWCICAATCNFCIPLPLSPAFGCVTMYQRWRIMDQFNIDGGWKEVLKGCCYPCALYQQFIFLEEMKRQRLYDFTTTSASGNSSLDRSLLKPVSSQSRKSTKPS